MAHHLQHVVDTADHGFEDLGFDHDEPAPRIHTPYEQVMGYTIMDESSRPQQPQDALAHRLQEFRKWLKEDAKCIVNPYLSIVNGEAHDGTKNAPTWTVEKSSWEETASSGGGSGGGTGEPSAVSDSSDRCGMIDMESDRDLYDRGMGCCVMATKEIKKEEVLMQIPRTAMITPDVVAASDAGRVALACCERIKKKKKNGDDDNNEGNEGDDDDEEEVSCTFWDSFEQAGEMLERNKEKFKTNRGEHLLIRILQERKKAETATRRHELEVQQQQNSSSNTKIPYKLAPKKTLSRKVPFQLFLIQQRFANDASPAIVSKLLMATNKNKNDDNDDDDDDDDELNGVDSSIHLSEDAPTTFGPYARTLPSVIPLPVCWRRQELALLSGCVSGSDALQEVVARTVQLVSEYKTLLEAGIFHRFPNVFPPGMITWERWMWSDAILTSRLLPTECFLNHGDKRADSMSEPVIPAMQSPPSVWDDLGVLIPLLDMLNHECDDAPITWDQNVTRTMTITTTTTPNNNKNTATKQQEVNPHLPRARAHKRIRKHMQMYVSYGSNCNNYDLMTRYGFAVTRNPNDEVKIGWSISGAVGNGAGDTIEVPKDYVSPFPDDDEEEEATKDDNDENDDDDDKKDKESSKNTEPKHRPLSMDLVFEASAAPTDNDDSTRKDATIKSWWTSERFALLEHEMKGMDQDSFHASLRTNKPLVIMAHNNGTYHPHLLVAATIATMPPERVEHYYLSLFGEDNDDDDDDNNDKDEKMKVEKDTTISLTRRHAKVLQRYLHFFFTNKIEKLLTGLSSLVSNHFDKIKLWTKMAHGGLHYVGEESNSNSSNNKSNNKKKSSSSTTTTTTSTDGASGGTQPMVGWVEFVNSYGIPYSIETEKSKKYCALTPDACALFFYDGHLNALQTSLDGVIEDSTFEQHVLNPLQEELGFHLLSKEEEAKEVLLQKKKPPKSTTTMKEEPASEPEESSTTTKPEEKRKATEVSKTNGVSDPSSSTAASNKDNENNNNHNTSNSNNNHKPKKKKNKKSKRQQHNGNDHRPPTIKLHIGNLSYQTQTSDLYDYFGTLYGRDNVLECHIPVERETGRSRGFGFVTLPEAVAVSILQSERKHEIKGRLLKVAESNSAGSSTSRGGRGGAQLPNDRCTRCGYRPKYCVCPTPELPVPMNGSHRGGGGAHPYPPHHHHHEHPPPPRYGMYHGGGGDPYGRDAGYDYYSGYHHHHRRERDSHNSSRSPTSSSRRSRRDRDYDYHHRSSYDRSRSRSYSRDRGGRSGDHHRSSERRRRRSRSRDRHRSSSRRYDRDHRSSRSSRYNSRSHSDESDDDQSYHGTDHGGGSRRSDRDRDNVSIEGGGRGGGKTTTTTTTSTTAATTATTTTSSPSRSISPPSSHRRRRRSRSRSRDRRSSRRSGKKSRKRRSRSRSPTSTGQSSSRNDK